MMTALHARTYCYATDMSRVNRMLVYVLRCEHEKWYVGRTMRGDIRMRFEEHRQGKGAAWTRLYRPIRVEETRFTEDPFEEDRLLKALMHCHGMHNVRGGSYSMPVLPNYKERALREELRNATFACFVCGNVGHFASQCKARGTSSSSR